MKSFAIFLFGLLAIAVVIYVVPPLRQQALKDLSYSQCDSPLQYKLGPIDPKFGLTTSEVLRDIKSATDIWSTAWTKPLFIYSPNAALTVQFVYDQRAALNTQINQLQSQLSQNNSSLTDQINSYNAQVSAFEEQLAAFNAKVATYNSQGGAPQDVYAKLVRQQNDLNAEGDRLNALAKQLNLSTNNYNSNVSILNGEITQLNNDLAQKPEEGLYVSANNTITVYFANNQQELEHTLAHEFGHALGMVHVQNPKAIMYAYALQSLEVTPEDMQQLHYVCREQSAIIHDVQEFDLWILTAMQNVRQRVMSRPH